ncbi:MAG: DUF3772 domain-containing protein [Pseudomonadota bacterium]
MIRALSRLFLLFWLCAAPMAVGLSPTVIHAQAAGLSEEERETWQRLATRAEEAVANARASTPALETLRLDLVRWREIFLEARQTNSRSIATVQRQIETLGPVPEDGVESDDIAAERASLNDQLATLEAPVRTAELGFSRADGLIRAIDTIVRERQAQELLEFGPSPLNPANWPGAIEVLTDTYDLVRGEFRAAWSIDLQRRQAKEAMPFIAVLTILGSVLILRGRSWSRHVTARVVGEDPGAARWLAGFGLSLGSLVLPMLGIFLLTRAIYTTGLVGLRGEQLLDNVVPAAFAFLFARWLASRMFPAREARTLPLNLTETQRRSGRLFGAYLGLIAGLHFFFKDMAAIGNWPDDATVTVLYPFLFFAALMLLWITQLLRAHRKNATEENEDETYRNRLMKVLVLALGVVALLSPVFGALGYFELAQFILFPTLRSLLILAALTILQRLVYEIYVLVTEDREGASNSLIPIFIGFCLVLGALPILALIWGARVTDLQEIWSQIINGFDLGGITISPAVFFTLIIVFVIGYTGTRLLQGTLRNTVLPKTKIDPGGQVAIVSGLGYVGIFLAAVIAITSAGIDLSSLAIVAGALSVGIGFGLQNIVSNFVSGIILLIERPISIGDWIEVGGVHGTVRKISVRSTVIETFDRSDVIVPNSDFVSGTVTNYTHGNTVGRVIVPVGVAYGTDPRKVEKILSEVARDHPMVLLSTPPAIIFQGFGADSLDFEIRAILRDVNYVLSTRSEMNFEIARRFQEEGIEIPFAQRDIWIRNPEALPAAASEGGSEVRSDNIDAHLTEDDMDGPDTDGDAGGDGDGR